MQVEFFGNKSIQKLNTILGEFEPERVFIVSGGNSYRLSGAQKAIENGLAGIKFERYWGFEENPKFKEMLAGAEKIREFNPDLIMAVGGGSVMDTAKIISVLPEDISEAEMIITGEEKDLKKIAPIVAIPTTSGSGSEATHFAVAYKDGSKYSVAHECLLPDRVIIDPELTHTMSSYQTAVSGLDTLCQAIESRWAKNSTQESHEYAEEAIKLAYNNIKEVVSAPSPENRLSMAKASNLAGKSINISKTTAPHALSYAITTHYGIPHGHAVALTLGSFFEVNTDADLQNGEEKIDQAMKSIFRCMNCDTPEEARSEWYELLGSLGLKTKLGELGVNSEQELNILADAVNLERLKNHPVSISKEIIVRILNGIL